MPRQVYIEPIDVGAFQVEGAQWQQWEVEDGIKVVLALLQGIGPGAAPGNVKALLTDAAGNLRVTMVSATQVSAVGIIDTATGNRMSIIGSQDSLGVFTRPLVSAELGLWNNASTDRGRSASAANLAAKSGLGVALTGEPGEWAASAAAALGSASSATQAAGAAGVRHICQGFSIIVTSQAAPAAGTLTINLRDGASGLGTILETFAIQIPAALYAPIVIERGGLNIVGSAATAMTLESAAAYAAVGVSVAFEGYDAA